MREGSKSYTVVLRTSSTEIKNSTAESCTRFFLGGVGNRLRHAATRSNKISLEEERARPSLRGEHLSRMQRPRGADLPPT